MQKINANENDISEFLINLSLILYGNNNKLKVDYLNSFKGYLSSIFQSDNKITFLFNTLEYLIFQNNKNKIIINKKLLSLYPFIFDFNPKISYNYIINFLNVLQKCSMVNDIQFLTYLFTQVINIFFNENTCYTKSISKKNVFSSSLFVNKNNNEQLYIKILNYCLNMIEYNCDNNKSKKNKGIKNSGKNEHLLGCVFLSILIDKLTFISNQNIINNFWNIISYFFSKKNFNYIYDILYCTLKLILVTKEKFKNYCKLCLFKILDYLTDDNWMIRKISLEIIFALSKYCKKDILSVKEDIIDFLNVLKDDRVPQVKDVCIQTLNLINEEENNPINIKKDNLNLENNNNEEFTSNEDTTINKESPNNNTRIVNISILDGENEKNDSKDNIPFFGNNKASINYINNENNINDPNNYFEILNHNNNTYDNKNIITTSDDCESKLSDLRVRNYSTDNYNNNTNRKTKRIENQNSSSDIPAFKRKNKIKLFINNNPHSNNSNNNNVNYINYIKNNQKENNVFSVSKLAYSVIQNNNITFNREKSDDELLSYKSKKYKCIANNEDISSNSVKNMQIPKINVNKKFNNKFISDLKIRNDNIFSSSISLNKFKIKKEKNNNNNNSMEYKHTDINYYNGNRKKNLKENGQINKGKNDNKNKNNMMQKKSKDKNNKVKSNYKTKDTSKQNTVKKYNNNKPFVKTKCNNNNSKKKENKSYLNFQKKYDRKSNNNSCLLNQKKSKPIINVIKNNNNTTKNEKKKCNTIIKKVLVKKINEREKSTNTLEANPKLNLLPLFTEGNIHKNNNSNNININMIKNSNEIQNNDNSNNNENEIKNNNENNNENGNENKNENNNNENNKENTNNNNHNNDNQDGIRLITEQLNNLFEGQNMLMTIINNLKDKVDDNYKNINERLLTYERNKTYDNKIRRRKMQNDNYNDTIKLEMIKQKYNELKFNDALLESIQKDIFLFNLLPMIKIEDLKNINIFLIEDIISRLSLKLTSIVKNNNSNRIYLEIILSFFHLVVSSKIKLKTVTKLNLEDSLNYIKNDYKSFRITNNELKLIENIIKSIKKL